MPSTQEFRPDWVSAPGDTMTDILRERDLSEVEFAKQIGQTNEEAQDLLHGRATITIGIARQLERALGASVEFWMSRDVQYRHDVARLEAEPEWLQELPVGDMIRFGWISPVPHPSEEVAACLRFFGVPSVRAWRRVYGELQQMVAFRTSPSFDSSPGAVAAWLRQGEIQTGGLKCGSWDATRFEKSLQAIRPLTRLKDPGSFIPKLQNLCAAAGVAVAVVRPPTGCRASGATRFFSPKKALLLLSFRYLSDDHFWFTFFHEAGHLLLHDGGRLFLEGVDMDSTPEEQEANEFAARTLIPTEYQNELLSLRVNSREAAREVIKFAQRLGISPGIVVGQLQHYQRIKPHRLNSVKRRFEWSD
jgi:HTH-type transcriptional regulator/antitoxin HigA